MHPIQWPDPDIDSQEIGHLYVAIKSGLKVFCVRPPIHCHIAQDSTTYPLLGYLPDLPHISLQVKYHFNPVV